MSAENKRPTHTVAAIPSDIHSSVFLGNPALDNVVACLIAMSGEMWATRRRLKVLESLLASKGVTPDMIEAYVPTAEENAAWEKERDRFVSLALGSLGNDGFRNISADFPPR
jgi:hypothetical protein